MRYNTNFAHFNYTLRTTLCSAQLFWNNNKEPCFKKNVIHFIGGRNKQSKLDVQVVEGNGERKSISSFLATSVRTFASCC